MERASGLIWLKSIPRQISGEGADVADFAAKYHGSSRDRQRSPGARRLRMSGSTVNAADVATRSSDRRRAEALEFGRRHAAHRASLTNWLVSVAVVWRPHCDGAFFHRDRLFVHERKRIAAANRRTAS